MAADAYGHAYMQGAGHYLGGNPYGDYGDVSGLPPGSFGVFDAAAMGAPGAVWAAYGGLEQMHAGHMYGAPGAYHMGFAQGDLGGTFLNPALGPPCDPDAGASAAAFSQPTATPASTSRPATEVSSAPSASSWSASADSPASPALASVPGATASRAPAARGAERGGRADGAAAAAGGEDDLSLSSDEDAWRRGQRHKRRAGRVVRERRLGRGGRHDQARRCSNIMRNAAPTPRAK